MPGAGKSTVCNKLLTQWMSNPNDEGKGERLFHVSPGNLLRRLETKGDALAREILDGRREGGQKMDRINTKIICTELTSKRTHKGQPFVLDGFPVTLGAAQELFRLSPGIFNSIKKVVVMNVTQATAVERLTLRRVHIPSGRVYHLKTNPPQVEGLDDVTGEELTVRPDDYEEIVLRRLDFYRKSIPEVEAFFTSKGIQVVRIPTDGPPKQVFAIVNGQLNVLK